ncbi:class I SAM-dependent methyltransferase [Hydrogenophaga pseudoflava]|uniref:class I SAM-dependent methyltransferase n=1 Tax=Hydrogenophaga pseudoflava TaxID=47421 RepID=UPI0027E4D2C4|nr:methyltransferase domain-containing protein [Hydrogenophaga pseudoflava]MDQ7745541.1 methyltransferase domain-containing protein [Hydrogenophaga pseudoflava]
MKISHGLQDQGIVVGNVFDKYESRNPLVRGIMRQFNNGLAQLVARAAPENIHELGCGEGHWVLQWAQQGIDARGSDFSEKVIAIARDNALNAKLDPEMFSVRSIYEIERGSDDADLIVCSEVLEHLADPLAGLAAIQRVASRHVILTVPREPVWRAMNMARGAYWGDLGNTPGHLQHWSKRQFISLAQQFFEVIDVKTPLPWTMLLCKVKA